MMAYPGTQADWYYDGAVRPRRGIHDVWASQSQVQAAALERRRRLLLRFRLAARLCRLKAQEKKPLEKLKELFAESTTGIDRLVVIENRCRFWIFCTVYVVFFVVTVISIGKTLQNHFEYRDIVSISMTEGNSLQLPAVTFCNLNPLRKSAVCSPNTLDVINGTIRNILCDQSDPMDINMVHNFTTEELYPFLNVARKYNNSQTLLALGHTKQRMVLNCTVKGESCLDDSMYETSTNPTFGLCYCIFCSNFNASKISYQASNLPVDGLTLVLDIEREEYLRSSSEMGMIVMVHRRGVSPDPNEDGMYLSPLMTTYIGIEMRMMERLPAPYKDRCVTMWPPIWQKYVAPDQTYFQQMCFSVCSQVLILKKCQCMSEELPQVRNVTGAANIMCRNDDHRRICSEEILADTSYRSLKKCDCPLKCSQEIYKTSISRTGWAQSLRSGEGKNSLQNRALVKAVIYFESIIVEKITQVPELSDATTLSNVGGFMGMYLGLSFLVIFEILEIFVRWLIYLYQRRRAVVAPQPTQPTASLAAWQRHANKAIQASKDDKGWSKQRTIWDILKDPGVNTGGLVALRRPSGAPQYGYFDSSDWKSAADEVFGPFNPLFLHRSFRPRAFY
ncbi:acid-sensing ion channel 1C [Rhipicephalus microplus]|uniref:acid-sensing ion channel 1C n=1 Tax=Rhipicephalus microplus TaxID=6941 RepID=UPI003F6C2C05